MTVKEILEILKGIDNDTAYEMKWAFEMLDSFGIDFAKDGEKVAKAVKKLKVNGY